MVCDPSLSPTTLQPGVGLETKLFETVPHARFGKLTESGGCGCVNLHMLPQVGKQQQSVKVEGGPSSLMPCNKSRQRFIKAAVKEGEPYHVVVRFIEGRSLAIRQGGDENAAPSDPGSLNQANLLKDLRQQVGCAPVALHAGCFQE